MVGRYLQVSTCNVTYLTILCLFPTACQKQLEKFFRSSLRRGGAYDQLICVIIPGLNISSCGDLVTLVVSLSMPQRRRRAQHLG
jgi:hypothetical protein